MWILLPNIDLRCFVARQFLSRIYALLSVKFSGLKMCECKKMTNIRYACHWMSESYPGDFLCKFWKNAYNFDNFYNPNIFLIHLMFDNFDIYGQFLQLWQFSFFWTVLTLLTISDKFDNDNYEWNWTAFAILVSEGKTNFWNQFREHSREMVWFRSCPKSAESQIYHWH